MHHKPGWILANKPDEIGIDAVLYRSDNSTVAVCLANMSFEGCDLVVVDTFEAGERVRMQIDGQGYIHAEISWSSEGRLGAKFLSECPV